MAFIPSYWREIPHRYRYEGNKCVKCECHGAEKCDCEGRVFFPSRRSCCPWCDCTLEPVTIATTGKVLTYTVIHIAPDQFADEAPYALAICEMDDGARLQAQLVDCPLESVKTGMPVRIEFRRIQQDGEAGILMYGYKVVPV
jgi:uncharacterized OB-fold protein